MTWALAVITLLVVGYVCRRILRLDEPPRARGIGVLSEEREKLFEPVSLELETRVVLLGMSLNEALERRHSGDKENAWHSVRLATCQWEGLSKFVGSVLNLVVDYIPQTRSIGPVRDLAADPFESQTMIQFVRQGAVVHQFIFRSKARYASHIHVIRRALDALTGEFCGSCDTAPPSTKPSEEVWNLVAPSYHDFDVVTKEALLAFRGLLLAAPPSVLPAIAVDIDRILAHSVRQTPTKTLQVQ